MSNQGYRANQGHQGHRANQGPNQGHHQGHRANQGHYQGPNQGHHQGPNQGPNQGHRANQGHQEFRKLIQYYGRHAAIVMGKRGATIKALSQKSRCRISIPKIAELPEEEQCQFPCIIVTGQHEKNVHMITIEISEMLMTSMMRAARKDRVEKEDLSQENGHLRVKVDDLESQLKEKDFDIDHMKSCGKGGEPTDEINHYSPTSPIYNPGPIDFAEPPSPKSPTP